MKNRVKNIDHLYDETAKSVGEEAFHKAYKDHGAVMYVVDLSSFRIVDANQAALKFYGYDHPTMLTKRIPDLNITPENEIRTEIKAATDEGRSYYIFKHQLSNGELRDVEILAPCKFMNSFAGTLVGNIYEPYAFKMIGNMIQ